MASSQGASRHRRLAAIIAATGDRVYQRERLRERATAARCLRPALDAAGIDPAQALADWWTIADAQQRLSELGDTPELQRRDAEFGAEYPRLAYRGRFAGAAAERAAGFVGQLPPRHGAALVDWYAWALALARTNTPNASADFQEPISSE
jgi:hypothetical protein